MSLPKTKLAIGELLSEAQLAQGMHIQPQPRSGVHGLTIGEIPFDPSRHSPSDVLNFSIFGEATGQDYVAQTLPSRPISMSLVADYRLDGDIAEVDHFKRALVGKITSEIGQIGTLSDRIFSYHIGVPSADSIYDSEPLRGREDFTAAQSIAEICSQGLTVVVGSLRNLPLAETGVNLEDLIAVKVNHPAERKILANVGVIALGNGLEVNTDVPEHVEAADSYLDKQHRAVVSSLQKSGAKIVEVVWSPRFESGLDAEHVDNAIAEAINAYGKNKH